MTGHIVIRSSPPPAYPHRRHPLLTGTLTPPTSTPTSISSLTPTPTRNRSPNVGEVAGGTAAECFAVLCCCPGVLVECLFLAVYKVPAAVLKRLLKKRRQKKMLSRKKKKALLHPEPPPPPPPAAGGNHHHANYSDELSDVDLKEFETIKVSIDGSAEVVELDRFMWDQFQNSGFWRSHSQRHTC